jgi:hypothetical protein
MKGDKVMNEHNIFYYPYASVRNDQAPLLKAAALYFDKLYILDPAGASCGITDKGAYNLHILKEVDS